MEVKIVDIFGLFDNPKCDLINCISLAKTKMLLFWILLLEQAPVAHSVPSLEREDGGNRKFILVECENYADKITAERVRRVIKGVPKSKDDNLKNGLGGSFTYCTLGDEISVEKMLTGKNLPDYDTLARHVFYTATGQSPAKIRKQRGQDGLFYETGDRLFYLIYQPSLAFLRSTDSALNSDRTERIAKRPAQKRKPRLSLPRINLWGKKN